jgi:hypothetical protein
MPTTLAPPVTAHGLTAYHAPADGGHSALWVVRDCRTGAQVSLWVEATGCWRVGAVFGRNRTVAAMLKAVSRVMRRKA